MTGVVVASSGCRGGGGGQKARGESQQQQQLSMVALLMATIRKSMVYCRVSFREEDVVSAAAEGIDIGWPTEVQHVAHVTFDRFKGFLGLPVEFELEVSCSAPSASASVFGVSAELMQCGFDSKGNSVPIILLLMQERLYSQGGLQAEGIFRINPENSEEKDLRNQLNKGIIPDDIDVHCLAGLIKAWFRELPVGVLDSLSPGQVLQCENEEDCVELVKLLPPMQFALVKWVVNLMADVVEEEEVNKMNARNIAMVFAPNMTQLSDPLTSLMHAVQVMNLLQTLIFRTLRERDEEAGATDKDWSFSCSPSPDCDGNETDESRESSSEDDCGVVGHVTGDALQVATASDLQGFHYESSIDEGEIVEEIQECFLRHLELDWDRDSKDAGRELVRPRIDCCGYQETKFSCTQLSTSDSSVTVSEINHSNSSITVNDVDSDTKPSEPVEHDRGLEMIADATEFSFTHLSTSESSVMVSESDHCNSSRTVSDVDSVTVVPEDVSVDARPPEPPIEDDEELEMVTDATKLCCNDSSISNRSNIDDMVPEDVAMVLI